MVGRDWGASHVAPGEYHELPRRRAHPDRLLPPPGPGFGHRHHHLLPQADRKRVQTRCAAHQRRFPLASFLLLFKGRLSCCCGRGAVWNY